MTDHVYGPDSYIECDRYTVISEDQRNHPFTECYCGTEAEYVACVGFFTVIEERDNWIDRTLNETLKAHRCPEHRFEE